MLMAVVAPVENLAIIFSWEVAIHETSGLAELVSLSCLLMFVLWYL
jgi:hypothetical protein